MQALELLQQRSSMPRLTAPGPSPTQLALMYEAAMRAPDHAQLQPFRWIEVNAPRLSALGALFGAAASARGQSAEEIARAADLVNRAPCILVSVVRYQQHDKVPHWEQLASASCATSMLLQAAFAQHLGAIWRTGWLCDDALVKEGLGIAHDEAIIGFIYVGTPAVATVIKPRKDWRPKVTIF